MSGLGNLKNALRRYIDDVSGAIAIMFGLMVPVLIGVGGISLDYAQAYLVQQRLSQAIDAAALAAAAGATSEADIRKRVKDFFDANYPEEKIGATFDPVVNIVGDEVRVSGSAAYNTRFLVVLGIDTIDVSASTTVIREVQGIEVVLVLDNTGSMGTNNNIGALRNAASNFVYIMYGIGTEAGADADPDDLDNMATRDRNHIKIGMVPYSTAVNVGPYGIGETPDGSYYGPSFVNNPHNLNYTTNYNTSNDWFGCVIEHDYPLDTEDHPGPWDMYRWCRDENEQPYCNVKYNKYTKQYYVSKKPNNICVRTPITPLVTSPTQLKKSINTMVASGNTLGNVGMVWGYRVISPDFPFEEGVEWGNNYWRKAVVMMTDGQNVMHNTYSAYGPSKDNNIGVYDLNNRFLEVCDNLKEQGVLVYTVTFYSGVSESTKGYYRQCATSEDYYHDAPDQEDLVEVFETISRELSNLHIKE